MWMDQSIKFCGLVAVDWSDSGLGSLLENHVGNFSEHRNFFFLISTTDRAFFQAFKAAFHSLESGLSSGVRVSTIILPSLSLASPGVLLEMKSSKMIFALIITPGKAVTRGASLSEVIVVAEKSEVLHLEFPAGPSTHTRRSPPSTPTDASHTV
ncbi:hypothetical protein U1Q18_045495 [Sarracenia purpurea var. burkii]